MTARRRLPRRRRRHILRVIRDMGPSDAELLATKVDPEIVEKYGEPKPATPEQAAELAAAIAANGGVLPEISFEEVIERVYEVRQEVHLLALAEAKARGEEPSPEVLRLSERWARHELTDAEYADAVYEHLGFKPHDTEQ